MARFEDDDEEAAGLAIGRAWRCVATKIAASSISIPASWQLGSKALGALRPSALRRRGSGDAEPIDEQRVTGPKSRVQHRSQSHPPNSQLVGPQDLTNELMNQFFEQDRGKLWIAQAVAFVLLGVFVASWFARFGWAGRSDDAPSVRTGEMQSKPSIWTCRRTLKSVATVQGRVRSADGLGAGPGVGRWSSYGFDQF